MSKYLNRISAIGIMILNFGWFLKLTLNIIISTGGPMGYALITLPVSILVNLLLIPAILAFGKKHGDSYVLTTINAVGLVWATVWFFLFFVW